LLHTFYVSLHKLPEFPLLYIIATLVLEFAKDESFIESIQKIRFVTPEWFKERMFSHMTLCDMTIFIVLRLIQLNFQFKDSHLHILSCGSLIHISRKTSGVHNIVCRRIARCFALIVSFLTSLVKKQDQWTSLHSDIVALLLEMMHIYVERPRQTANSIYTLLQCDDMLRLLKNHSRFSVICSNLLEVMLSNC
jgi:hypothetical protein